MVPQLLFSGFQHKPQGFSVKIRRPLPEIVLDQTVPARIRVSQLADSLPSQFGIRPQEKGKPFGPEEHLLVIHIDDPFDRLLRIKNGQCHQGRATDDLSRAG